MEKYPRSSSSSSSLNNSTRSLLVEYLLDRSSPPSSSPTPFKSSARPNYVSQQVNRSSTNPPSPPTHFNSPTRTTNSFSEPELAIGKSVRTSKIQSLCETKTDSLSASTELVERKEHVTNIEHEMNQGDHHSISGFTLNMPKPTVIVVNDNVFELIMSCDKLEKKGLGVVMTTDIKIAFRLIGGTLPSEEFKCPRCGSEYPDAKILNEHKCSMTVCPVKRKFPCPALGCDLILSTAQTLGKHVKTHEVDERTCLQCGKTFESVQKKNGHQSAHVKAYKKNQVQQAYNELKIAYEELSGLKEALEDENNQLRQNQRKEPAVVLLSSTFSDTSIFLKMVKEQSITKAQVVVMAPKTEAKAKYLEEGAADVVLNPLEDDGVASIVNLFV